MRKRPTRIGVRRSGAVICKKAQKGKQSCRTLKTPGTGAGNGTVKKNFAWSIPQGGQEKHLARMPAPSNCQKGGLEKTLWFIRGA